MAGARSSKARNSSSSARRRAASRSVRCNSSRVRASSVAVWASRACCCSARVRCRRIWATSASCVVSWAETADSWATAASSSRCRSASCANSASMSANRRSSSFSSASAALRRSVANSLYVSHRLTPRISARISLRRLAVLVVNSSALPCNRKLALVKTSYFIRNSSSMVCCVSRTPDSVNTRQFVCSSPRTANSSCIVLPAALRRMTR